MFRPGHRGRWLLAALVLCLALAMPAMSRAAGEWHMIGLPPGLAPLGAGTAYKVVFLPRPGVGQPLPGFVACYESSTPSASVVPFWLPEVGDPYWDTASPDAQALSAQNGSPLMAASGSSVMVVSNASLQADFFDGAAWQVVGPIPALAAFGQVAFDAQGSGRAYAVHWSVPGGAFEVTGAGQTWTSMPGFVSVTSANGVAASGQRIVLQDGSGTILHGSSNGGLTSTPFPWAGGMADISAPPGPTGAFWGVGLFNAYVTIDDGGTGNWVATAHPGVPTSLIAVERFGSEAWILARDGSFHWQASGDAPDWNPQPGVYETHMTGLTNGYGLAVASPEEAVAVGDDGAGQPLMAWRNRPPGIPFLTENAVGEGSLLDKTLIGAATDPDGDPVDLSWSCDNGTSGTGATPGSPFTISVPDTPACDGEIYTMLCDITATELGAGTEGLSTTANTVSVQVTAIDDAPPVVAELRVSEGGTVRADPVEVAVGTAITAQLFASDVCDPNPLAYTWRLLDASGAAVAGLPAPVDESWNFPAPDPGASAQTYVVEATVSDAGGHAEVSTRSVTVHPPTVFTLNCPTELAAGDDTILTIDVQSGEASFGWGHSDPSAVPAVFVPAGTSATLATDPCGLVEPGMAIVVDVAPTGPGGGTPTNCLIRILPGTVVPTLDLDPPGDPILWELPATGGGLDLEPTSSFACGDDLVGLRWDLSLLPRVTHPPEAVGGVVNQLIAMPLTLEVGAAQVAAVLGTAGVFEGPLRLEARYLPGSWHDDDPTRYPPVVLARTLRIVPAPAVTTTVSLLGFGEIAPGEIVPARITFRADVPVSQVRLELESEGLSLVPGSQVQMESACATPAAASETSAEGFSLALDAVPAACEVELTVLLRVEWGTGRLALASCAWREGSIPCEGSDALERTGMFGCIQDAGGGGVAPSLIFFGLWGPWMLLRRRRWRS